VLNTESDVAGGEAAIRSHFAQWMAGVEQAGLLDMSALSK
jgi:hypothetical protein